MHRFETLSELAYSVGKYGYKEEHRNGKTIALHSCALELRYIDEGFIIPVYRKIPYRSAIGEFAALQRPIKHIRDFEKYGCRYWSKWAAPDGSLTLDYGNAIIDFYGIDQRRKIVRDIRDRENLRRLIISQWMPNHLVRLSLPCCWWAMQFHLHQDYLDMDWFQRSCDIVFGLPADMMLAQLYLATIAYSAGVKPRHINMILGNCHIYEAHQEALPLIEGDLPERFKYSLTATIFEFEPRDIAIHDYSYIKKSHEAFTNLKLEVIE